MEEENPAVCFGLPYDLRQCWGPVQTTVQPCPCFLISIVTLSWYAHRSISMLNSARRHITHSAVMVALGPAPNYATKHLRAPLHPKRRRRHMVDSSNTFYPSQEHRAGDKTGWYTGNHPVPQQYATYQYISMRTSERVLNV